MTEVTQEAGALVATVVTGAAILSGVGRLLPEVMLSSGAPAGESTTHWSFRRLTRVRRPGPSFTRCVR